MPHVRIIHNKNMQAIPLLYGIDNIHVVNIYAFVRFTLSIIRKTCASPKRQRKIDFEY